MLKVTEAYVSSMRPCLLKQKQTNKKQMDGKEGGKEGEKWCWEKKGRQIWVVCLFESREPTMCVWNSAGMESDYEHSAPTFSACLGFLEGSLSTLVCLSFRRIS